MLNLSNKKLLTTNISNTPQKSFYENTFLFESQENLYDSQYPNDYDICREEHIILDGSIFSLLKEINRKATLQNNASNNPSPRRIEFRSDRIYINKKRGRAPQNENKTKFHDNTQEDNLLTKIQTHFFTFIMHFCNDALKDEDKNFNGNFKNINHESKRTVNFNYTTQLKNSTIKDLLKLDISKKYKRIKKSYNRELLKKIEDSSPGLSELFEMSYLELFRNYYNKGIPLDKIVYKNKIIKLSNKTKSKSFSNLLDKNRLKHLEKYLIDITEKVYIC